MVEDFGLFGIYKEKVINSRVLTPFNVSIIFTLADFPFN
jgi:hypothetical protein